MNVTNVENGITVQLFTSSTSLIVDSLEPFTLYAITIAAQTGVGGGPYSIALSEITMEDGETIIIWFSIASFVNDKSFFSECHIVKKISGFQPSTYIYISQSACHSRDNIP